MRKQNLLAVGLLAIDEKAYGPDHPLVGTLLFSNLADIYERKQIRRGRIPLYKRSLAILDEMRSDQDHPYVAVCVQPIWRSFTMTRTNTNEAEPFYRQALDDRVNERLGPTTSAVGPAPRHDLGQNSIVPEAGMRRPNRCTGAR